MRNRIEQIVNWLQTKRIDAAFVSSSANVFYLTGFACDPHERLLGLWVFPNGKTVLICPLLENERVIDAGWQGEVYAYGDSEDTWQWMAQSFGHQQTIAIEQDHLTYRRAALLQTALGCQTIVDMDEQLRTMRMIKDEKEISILKKAANLADQAIQYGVEALCIGCTELEVVTHIETKLRDIGITQMAFSTMVLFGANTALPHGEPGSHKLEQGDLVLFDLGVVLEGYRSDITRTFVYGEPTAAQQVIYQAVLQANEQAIQAVASKQPLTFGKLDHVARTVIDQAGLGSYFTHRLGHGIGIETHEYPSVASDNDLPVQAGIVFTVEPGVYQPHVGGVRIEDMILVTEEGYEVLTNYPKKLISIL